MLTETDIQNIFERSIKPLLLTMIRSEDASVVIEYEDSIRIDVDSTKTAKDLTEALQTVISQLLIDTMLTCANGFAEETKKPDSKNSPKLRLVTD